MEETYVYVPYRWYDLLVILVEQETPRSSVSNIGQNDGEELFIQFNILNEEIYIT